MWGSKHDQPVRRDDRHRPAVEHFWPRRAGLCRPPRFKPAGTPGRNAVHRWRLGHRQNRVAAANFGAAATGQRPGHHLGPPRRRVVPRRGLGPRGHVVSARGAVLGVQRPGQHRLCPARARRPARCRGAPGGHDQAANGGPQARARQPQPGRSVRRHDQARGAGTGADHGPATAAAR